MATQFTDIEPLIRTLLGDTDPQLVMFSDAVLDSHIRLRILTDDNPDVQENGATRIFTKDLTAAQKSLVILKVAKAVISPVPDTFSYRNPVTAVLRKGGTIQLLAYLDAQIEEVEGGNIKFDTEIEAITNGALRFYSDYANAITSDRR
jgi:hypothetical protein